MSRHDRHLGGLVLAERVKIHQNNDHDVRGAAQRQVRPVRPVEELGPVPGIPAPNRPPSGAGDQANHLTG
jgi:hypothetical protein